MIKHDIVNELVNRTGITKTKAELAVNSVFGCMKRWLAKGGRIELRRDLECSMLSRARPVLAATRAPALKFLFRRAKRCDSSLARSYIRSSKLE